MRFIIYAGRPSSDDFTVIATDGITGELLSPGDTATATIYTKGEESMCILASLPLNIIDMSNGRFNLTLAPEQTSLLEGTVGFKEDGYQPLATHEMLLDFNLATGHRQAIVDVYVKRVPQCQM